MGGGPDLLTILGPLLAAAAIVGYLTLATNRTQQGPRHRTAFWILGSLAAAAAVSGPLADAADTNYVAHMASHLLLGMLAPLLMVLAAPATLLLRTLPVTVARRLSHLLRSRPARILTEPVVAATLNVGGLWLLYTTNLYPAMHYQPALHILIHAHMLLAGYLFTTAIISVDPLPHRRSYLHRSIVLIAALAAHDILAKHLYIHPPAGVTSPTAETGAMLMYYGGDLIDLTIIVILCARWYHPTRPRMTARQLASNP